MKSTILFAAVAAALNLTGMSAQASCADPRATPQAGAQRVAPPHTQARLTAERFHGGEDAGERIVGTWHVTYGVEGNYFADAFIQWHSDGTESESINLPVLGGNTCVGEWKSVNETHVSRNHVGWIYNNGILAGYFTEYELDAISPDGNSYSGTNDQKIFDVKGNLLVEVTGTSSAIRMWP